MIRVNLLPSDKKKRTRRMAATAMPAGDLSLRTWGLVYAGAIGVWLIVLGVLYFVQSGELETVALRHADVGEDHGEPAIPLGATERL